MYPYSDIRNNSVVRNANGMFEQGNGERFFWAPFLVGGLAGTALGYGIANNNELNNQGMYYQPIYYPYPNPTYVYPSQNTYYF